MGLGTPALSQTTVANATTTSSEPVVQRTRLREIMPVSTSQAVAITHGQMYGIVSVVRANNVISTPWSGYLTGNGPSAFPDFDLEAGDILKFVVCCSATGGATALQCMLVMDDSAYGKVERSPAYFYEPCGAGEPIRRIINPANPAAGADFLYTIPSNVRQRIRAMTAQLVTSATVANRTPWFKIANAAGQYHEISELQPAQVASTTRVYHWRENFTPGDAAADAINTLRLARGTSQNLEPTDLLASTTPNLQAADQWSGIWVDIEEWAWLAP